MMSEKRFRRQVIDTLRPLDAFAVENAVHDGTPDVCCTAGWLELKVAEVPYRDETRVAIGLRPAQVVWLRRWRLHGGRAWGLIALGNGHILLHDGHWASEHYDKANYAALVSGAIARWEGGITSAMSLINVLLEPLPKVTPF